MRIEFSLEGGLASFPGLSKPVAFDLDLLDKDEARQLQRLTEAANFFDLPASAGSPARAAADYQYCVLTIDDGTRKHTVRVLEPVEDRALEDLVQAVRKHVKAVRAAKRPS
jgi:hypothetical protein